MNIDYKFWGIIFLMWLFIKLKNSQEKSRAWKYIPNFLKILMTAHYDKDTKEIKNCKPDSFIWYHEFRHKMQDESGLLDLEYKWRKPLLNIWFPSFIFMMFIRIIFPTSLNPLFFFRIGLFYSFLIIILPELILEVDAHLYSIWRKIFG